MFTQLVQLTPNMDIVNLRTIYRPTCPTKNRAISLSSVMSMGEFFLMKSTKNAFDFSGQFLCDCPEGLYYNHRDGACHWPDARECCMKDDGLAHRPCNSFGGCQG